MLTERIREEIKEEEEEMGYGGMGYDDERIHEVQVSVLTDNPYQQEEGTNEQDQFYQTEEDPADVNQAKDDKDGQEQEE